MRAVASSAGDVGGDAFSSESLGAARARRLKALADDPSVPPFFGRIDRIPDNERPDGETFHVGRRHIRDQAGDPMVIDWRAPMSRAFYRATPAEPMGVAAPAPVRLRRRPAHLVRGRAADRRRRRWRPPRAGSCWRRSSGPASGRCATSSPRSSRTRTSWSGPSSTTASACRARRAPARPRSACTGRPTCSTPTRSGCGAPACWWSGRTGRSCATSARCCRPWARSASRSPPSTSCSRRSPIRALDPPAVATLKGDARLAEVLRRAVRRRIRRPEDGVVVIVGTRRYRIPPERLRRYVDDLRRSDDPVRDRPRAAARARGRGRPPAARGGRRRAVGRGDRAGGPVARRCASSWTRSGPRSTRPRCCCELYTDPAALAAAARGLLDPDEQELLSWATPPRSAEERPLVARRTRCWSTRSPA